MDTLLNLASTPEWWVSVVIVGVGINLLSSLVGAVIRRKFSRFVKRWSERTQKLAQRKTDRIEIIASSQSELYVALLELNRQRLEGIFEFVLAIVLLVLGGQIQDSLPWVSAAATIAGVLSMAQGLFSTLRYWQESELVQEARLKTARQRLAILEERFAQQGAAADAAKPRG